MPISKLSVHFIRLLTFLWLVSLPSSCSYLPSEYDFYGVEISEDADFIYVRSTMPTPTNVGVLYYPGGLVDPHAYIESLEELSRWVNIVAIAKHDANLAVLDSKKAKRFEEIFSKSLENSTSTDLPMRLIMGHSLGGAMACNYLSNNPKDFDAICLLASYPTENFNLADYQGAVLSITGTEDEVLNWEIYEEAKAYLPPGESYSEIGELPIDIEGNTTIYVSLDGANHAQFGSYGPQNGDGEAFISEEEQHILTREFILRFFNALGWI